MTAKRRCATLLAASACCTLAAAPGASAAKLTCASKGTTIAATAKVRVFTTQTKGKLEQRDWYGCLRSGGKVRALFDGATNETASTLRIVGTKVALVDRRIAPVDGIPEATALSVDLATGKTVQAPIGGNADAPAEDDFVLLASGAMAFVERDYDMATDQPSTTLGTLYKVTPAGKTAVATGTITGLAAAGTTIYWTQDGQPRSATA